MMIRNREVIAILLLVMSISAVPFATAESHYGPDCDAAYCFRTQTTLFDSNNNSTNYMYDIPTEWEDNYTAEEQIINAFDYWGMNYTTNQTDGNTSITEINGEQSNLTWHWAIYTKQNGVWTLNNLTINQIIVNKIPNYAVCLSDNNTNCGVESIDDHDEENENNTEDEYDPGTVPRISLWPGKVNQHNENGVWMTDPDGISGGHHHTEYPNDYGGREVEYCQKFWPNTTSVELMPERETITFYTEGNVDPYESTKDVWRCVGATSNSNPPVDGDSSDDSEDLSPDDEGWVITPGFPLVLSLGALSLASIIASKRRFESLE